MASWNKLASYIARPFREGKITLNIVILRGETFSVHSAIASSGCRTERSRPSVKWSSLPPYPSVKVMDYSFDVRRSSVAGQSTDAIATMTRFAYSQRPYIQQCRVIFRAPPGKQCHRDRLTLGLAPISAKNRSVSANDAVPGQNIRNFCKRPI